MDSKQILFWLSKGIIILLIIFMTLLSLDVFSENVNALDIAIGFIMHNIPTLILIILLITSWKNDLIGGIGFIIISIAFTIFFNTYQRLDTFLIISLPLLLSGILFLVHKYKIDTSNN